MKITEKIINDIFTHKLKLNKTNDKLKLSKYKELIPMYDIYTQQIYPISKKLLYTKLMDYHFRFISPEVVGWINNLYDKYVERLKVAQDDSKIQMTIFLEKMKNMLEIIDNYDIDILVMTSYKVLYQYSTGIIISICKRNSFNQYIKYLNPYYTKNELIKLGLNMGYKNLDLDNIVENTYFEICKSISNNDVSFGCIQRHSLKIIKNNTISSLTFYSFIGASLLNKFLRNHTSCIINKFYHKLLLNIINTIKQAPPLDNDYQMYRFIANDDFLSDLKVGDIFVDLGFTSTTRDPFYNPGLAGDFGLILIKINLKRDIPGIGLFIEHFSLFAKEEEFLLPPMTKLKLISKNDTFKYYHTDERFEKKIYKKYEFELVSVNYDWIDKICIEKSEIQTFNYDDFINTYTFINKLDLFQKFKNLSNDFNQIKINDFIFYIFFYDSTRSYSRYYYNKIEKGLSLFYFDKNNYPALSIELGKELVINFLNTQYFYNEKEIIDEKKLIELITDIGLLFHYKKAKIFHNYMNFSKFKNNYYSTQEIFLYLHNYDNTLYTYLKYNKKPFASEIFYKDMFYDIDHIVKKNVDPQTKKKYNFKGNTIKELLIYTIEYDFINYDEIIKIYEIEKLNWGEFNIYDKLIAENRINVMLELNYSENDVSDDTLDLVFRTPIRRT